MRCNFWYNKLNKSIVVVFNLYFNIFFLLIDIVDTESVTHLHFH